jgi:serine protease Do
MQRKRHLNLHPKDKTSDNLGIRVAEITPEMVQRFNLPDDSGVIVTDIASDSKAGEAGLQVGDVIKEINHKEVNSIEDYRKALSTTDKEISMFVRRQQAGFIVIKIPR